MGFDHIEFLLEEPTWKAILPFIDYTIVLLQGGFFDWSALKNDQVSDYIVNPIKNVASVKFPVVWHLVIYMADQSEKPPCRSLLEITNTDQLRV